MTRIKFTPMTGEIEIEGSEAFVKTYLKKVQGFVSGQEKKKPTKKVEKTITKTKNGPSKGSYVESVLSVLKKNEQGLSINDIAKKTKLTVSQVNPILGKVLKLGKVQRIGRGMYSL